MGHVGQVGGKGHAQVVPHRVDQKTVALPVEVVVVGDGGDLGFGDDFGQRDPQRHVHGNRQGVLGDQDVDLETFDEFVDLDFQKRFYGVDGFRHRRFAQIVAEDPLIDPAVLGIVEMGFGHKQALRRRLVEFAREPVAAVSVVAVQDLGPFAGLQ